jgi:hypothetical protein
MDKKTAIALSGLVAREYPDGAYEFLRCQLGEFERKKVQLSAYRVVEEKVFHLLAYGKTWEEALEMLEKR